MNHSFSTVSRLLFNVEEGALNRTLSQSAKVCCGKGEVIYSPRVFRRSLAFLLDGMVQVTKDELVVSTLRTGDVFGAAALFNGGEEYACTLTALTDCVVLFTPQKAVLALLHESPAFVENYVRYLSGRIRFLSSRLDAVSAGTAAQKLAQFLLSDMDQAHTLTSSAAALCRRLGISRASLYRAFDALERAGAIRREQKRIVVLDPEKLQTI